MNFFGRLCNNFRTYKSGKHPIWAFLDRLDLLRAGPHPESALRGSFTKIAAAVVPVVVAIVPVAVGAAVVADVAVAVGAVAETCQV